MKVHTLLHINIEKKKHLDKINAFIDKEKPDLICMEEVGSEDIKNFAQEFGYDYTHASKYFAKDTNQGQGQGILSRYELLNVKKHRYDNGLKGAVPRFFNTIFKVRKPKRPLEQFQFHETLLSGEVELESGVVTIATTHFPVADLSSPGLPDHELFDTESLNYVQNVRSYFDRLILNIRSIKGPLIFTSDLNSPRGNFIYDALAHELIDRIPEGIDSSIDPNLHRVKDLKLMVDTVMTSKEVNVHEVKVIEGISDHKGFLINFSLNS